MNQRTKIIDNEDPAARMRESNAAFQQEPEAQLPAVVGPTVSVHDGVITAQRVAIMRDLPKVLQNIKVLAAMAGEDWYYRFPVKKRDGGTDWIEGPSIKCANNVARMYGNDQIDTRVVDSGDAWTIYARFVDYETGFSYTRPFQQRKGQGSMKTDDARARDIALQIGVSKAIRNVVCNALETFTTYAFEEAKKNLVERVGKKLGEYRTRVLARLDELKVPLKNVEAALGRIAQDWLAHDVARLIAELQSVADGMAAAGELWPGEAPAAPERADYVKEGDGKTAGQTGDQTTVGGKKEDAKPAAEQKTEFTIVLNDGSELIAGSAANYAQTLLKEANQKINDKPMLDGLWESNSPTFANLPPEIAMQLRDSWPKFEKKADGKKSETGKLAV